MGALPLSNPSVVSRMHLGKEECGCGRDHKMDIVGLYIWVWWSRGGRGGGGDPCLCVLCHSSAIVLIVRTRLMCVQ